MPAQWFAVKRNSDAAIVSFVSDDAAGFVNNIPGFTLLGPFPTQQAAIAANLTIVPDVNASTIAALHAKASPAWTLVDIADWLKAKG